jgi:release factor glutamine methyltransferase
MATVLEVLNKSSKNLLSVNIKTAKIDSEIILASVLNTNRINLTTKRNLVLNKSQELLMSQLIARRVNKEPVAYILNKKDFWNETYFVDKRVLIPRPETEILIEMVLKKIKNKSEVLQIMDIGCGSGCLLISCLRELKKSIGMGLDISSDALEVSKVNIKNYNLNKRVELYKESIFTFSTLKKLDIILSNPPYLSSSEYDNLEEDVKNFEPKTALKGGYNGTLYYKRIIAFAALSLKKNGLLALELGDQQFLKIKEILIKNSFRILDKYRLINGETRCILASKIT